MNDMTEITAVAPAEFCHSQALLVADIHASPTNPRKTFPEHEQAELIESVKRHGVMTPILVRPWPEKYHTNDGGRPPAYELIAGERRYRAAKAAGLEHIPGTVRDLDDHETLELQIVENLHRKDLNELEEAEGYELMIKQYGYSAEDLAGKINKSKAYIYARLKLTSLCTTARKAFRDGKLTASTALLVARIPGAALQAKAIDDITTSWRGFMSAREAATHIQSNYYCYLDKAGFPQESPDLIPAAGACGICPKRSGTNPDAFADIERADVCTDPACYKAKQTAWLTIEKDRAREAGKTVIDGAEAKKIDVNYSQKYAALDKTDYSLPGAPTVREALKDKPIQTLLVEDEHSGKLVEVVEKKALAAALEAAGIKRDDYRERERDLERQARAENRFRRALFEQWHTTLQADLANDETPDLETTEMAMVASKLWAWMPSEDHETMMHLWAKPSDEKESWRRRHTMVTEIRDRIPTMSRRELVLFFMNCALASDGRCQLHSIDHHPTRLIECARDVGIDAARIRNDIAEEKAAKTKKSGSNKNAPAPTEAPQKGEPERKNEEPRAFAISDIVRVNNGMSDRVGRVTSVDSIKGIVGVQYLERTNGGIGGVFRIQDITWISEGSFITTEAALAADPKKDVETDEKTPDAKFHRALKILYTHPAYPECCWSGRGQKPKWVENWLKDGGTLDQLRVPDDQDHRCTKTLELPLP